MSSNATGPPGQGDNAREPRKRTAWHHIIRGYWRSPLGLFGVTLTTVSVSLMLVGIVVDLLGLFKNNPYTAVFTYLLLPMGMITGLAMIPLAAYLRRRQWHRSGKAREPLRIDLSDPRHRRFVIGFTALTVINVCILAIVAYEGYHFTDSPYFCGAVCHTVMDPEYTAYQRSPHARVVCVDCHIGSGADWYVRAKISGLRQVMAVMTGSYSRPIPAPVEHLRPARDTCEECHWPEKFTGKRVKAFSRFTEGDQKAPDVTEVALHIGGRNPITERFEGIHWHVSSDVEVRYLASDRRRTEIARVRVRYPDGREEEFVKDGVEVPSAKLDDWRLMDCIDCHNRPTHVFDQPSDRVDFGLLSGRINPDIPGIREDSLTVLTRVFPSRDAARELMVEELLDLQRLRDAAQAVRYEEDIRRAARYLNEAYLENVWPAMNVTWGTYLSHLGHQHEDEGFGCFRCHDDAHEGAGGRAISQDCGMCHDEPE